MVDVNGYRLSVVVDCCDMKNVRIKETETPSNCVKYFYFVITLCWILMDSKIKQMHKNYYLVI
jgi:hypothetical protein